MVVVVDVVTAVDVAVPFGIDRQLQADESMPPEL